VHVETTSIAGVWVLSSTPLEDDRGSFARVFDAAVVQALAPGFTVSQASTSHNRLAGTLRGMHWQSEPHEEWKIVRCTAGSVFDVAADVRPDSPTFGHWFGCELSADQPRSLLIGPGLAHGFVTLADLSDVSYLMSGNFFADASRGARYDDPALAIDWPRAPVVLSQRDAEWPLLVRG
jgi:dTDP-4-dehydrorhamnose 3,5-epimerase